MRSGRSSPIVFVFLSLLACGPAEQPPAQPALSPEQAAEARRQIVAWLECEECESGELEAVVKLGDTAVPTLAATLREGPSPASLEKLRLQLADTYRKITGEAAGSARTALEMSEDDYVKLYTENYVALYRVRAAQGLAAIGGPRAREALQQARDLQMRDDVRAVVTESLGRLQQ